VTLDELRAAIAALPAICEFAHERSPDRTMPCDALCMQKRVLELLDSALRHAKAEGRPQWQPIATYPKSLDYALLVSPAHGRVVGAHVVGDVWHLVGVGAVTSESERPTHWMPLPDPPTVSGSDRPDSERP
jgi:hypothetical protein